MIRFIPDYSIGHSGSSKNEVETISKQLTENSGHMSCEHHPFYENVMLCAVASNGFGIRPVDICCDEFKQSLIEYFGDAIY